jgi:hypothetical protein
MRDPGVPGQPGRMTTATVTAAAGWLAVRNSEVR